MRFGRSGCRGAGFAILAEIGAGPEAEEPVKSSISVSVMPSVRIEHEAQRLGLRGKVFPFSPIASPQQMQIRGFICLRNEPAIAKVWKMECPVKVGNYPAHNSSAAT